MFNMPRQQFMNRLIVILSIFLLFSVGIVFSFVYKPLKTELEKSLVENFQQFANVRHSSLQSNIRQDFEGTRSISSRSVIRDAILDYEKGELKLEELKSITQDKYIDGAKALENLMKAERFVENKLIASYYAEEYIEKNDEKWDEREKVIEKDYKITLVDNHEYLSVLSPIYADKKIVGYDELLFDLGAQIHELCTVEIKAKIIEQDQLDELMSHAKIIENNDGYSLFYKKANFYKAFHLEDSHSLIVKQNKKYLLEPAYQSTNNILFIGYGALILYTLIGYILTLWYANKKLSRSRVDLNQAMNTINIDKLTGVYSRIYGENLLEQAYQEFQKSEESPAILVFDIDYFKKINDKYGHLFGDYVLQIIVKEIERHIRPEDCIFRWGGDEFIGVFYDINQQDVPILAEKLTTAISELRIEVEDDTIYPSVSIGYSSFFKNDHKYTDAVRRADKAMYRNKFKQ